MNFSKSGIAKSRTNNSFAQMKDGTFIQIDYFIVDEDLGTEHVIYKAIATENFLPNHYSFLQTVKEINDTLASADVNEVENICVFLEIRNKKYICPVPNLFYC